MLSPEDTQHNNNIICKDGSLVKYAALKSDSALDVPDRFTTESTAV